MHSLKAHFIAFWVVLATLCIALALLMAVLFRTSAGALIAEARDSAEASCEAIAARYAKSVAAPDAEAPQLDLLDVLLQLVLIEAPNVEGGVWRKGDGFVAYAYPTYEGSGVKRDVPEAEQAHIATLAEVAARTGERHTDTVRGSREALIVSTCPLVSPANDLVAWTMTRTPATSFAAQDHLRLGLGGLLVCGVASGLWLGALLLRGQAHVRRLEASLAATDTGAGSVAPLPRTGVRELDRLVDGFNESQARFADAQARLREAARTQARDQRLLALGRMTGGLAHEIRNPIATMRLKAENALAGAPERQPQALGVILGQIARLDALVQSLLAVVQPIRIEAEPVDLRHWLAERIDAVRPKAEARHVGLVLDAADLQARIDAQHLGRAVDNLLDNAVRHAAEGGRVVVSAARATEGDTSRWWLRVDDDGAGVSADLQDRLFEPFATGDAGGTGLGLALAREVALAHGGDLRYRALAGGGSRFEMELPWPVS